MGVGRVRTALVTEAGGFLGTELISVLVARGHSVIGLVGSAQAAQRVRRAGALAVAADLLTPGQWQDETAADWVFHLPAHAFNGSRINQKQADWIARARLSM